MPSVPRLTIVADDLTGAMDVAAPLADRGLVTSVVASAEECTRAALPAVDVLSINADTRHLPEEQAVRRVRALMIALVSNDTQILVKKIDSTLRGNVVPESLAMLESSGRRIAAVAPAFPQQGRTVVNGVVHVHGVALKDTSFARDAVSRPPSEPLAALFRRADPDAEVHLVARGGPVVFPANKRRQIFVVDSGTDDDLRATLSSLKPHLRDTLLVGSAGVAEALAEVCFRSNAEVASPVSTGTLLFVVGSRTEQSAQQVGALVAALSAHVLSAPNGRFDSDAMIPGGQPILVLQATTDQQGNGIDPGTVAWRLAEGVGQLLQRLPITAVVATGGDTAVAILRHLSQIVVPVAGNLSPGIAFSRIRYGTRDLWFVTKAGGFGSPDAFVNIVRRLRGEA